MQIFDSNLLDKLLINYMHSFKSFVLDCTQEYNITFDSNVFYTFVINKFNTYSITCNGCINNLPEQYAHMDLGGCLHK